MIASLLCAPCLALCGGTDGFVEAKLANGVRLSVLEVKEAARQSFLAFLPLGLAFDDEGCAQWSHALEHMLIRATDAEGMSDGEIEFNGETSDGALRLDVYAPPAESARAAAKLAAWLRAVDFDAAVLEREKKNIGRELANTTRNGFNHKWATAAWAQVVRHGATVVAVNGDVERATAAALTQYGARKIVLGPRVRIVAVGPLAADAVKALFDDAFGKEAAAAAMPEKAGEPATRELAPELQHGELAATWDLPATHYLEWYLLPDATPADRASSMLVANVLMMKLQADPELAAEKILALASADVVLPQGRVLFLSASLPTPELATKALAAKAFRRAIDGLDEVPRIGALSAYIAMAKSEFAGLPDFAAYRKAWKGRPNAELMEAQVVLSLAAREWSSGLTFQELGAAIGAVTAKELLARCSKLLDARLASHLVLTPRD